MNNFEVFKKSLTPDQLAHWIRCSECPLIDNGCGGFINIQGPKPLKQCTAKLMAWFNQEAQ